MFFIILRWLEHRIVCLLSLCFLVLLISLFNLETQGLIGVRCDLHSECSGVYKHTEGDRARGLQDVRVSAVEKEGCRDLVGGSQGLFGVRSTQCT